MSTETEVLWLDERRVVSLQELAEVSGLSEAELRELVQLGALPAGSGAGGSYEFSARVVTVARTAGRLRDELELDLTSLGVALRLLERVQDLEDELARVRALLPRV
jgi:chaperone modulatory protein CbpM